jgi:hypothetical protein
MPLMSLYRRYHDRFGTAGVVLGVIALVLALGGSAIAASGLSGPEQKLIQKEAKKWGKKFAKQGPAGPAGQNGTNGKDGSSGQNGTPGAPGAAGKSVVLGSAVPGCSEGGVSVEVEGSGTKKEVCNGENGTTGFTDTLPSGKTETGTWSYSASTASSEEVEPGLWVTRPTISFNIPLASLIPSEKIKLGGPGGDTHCSTDGQAFQNPTADPGYLCIYPGSEFPNGEIYAEFPANPIGVVGAELNVIVTGDPALGTGSFAVTAP